MLFDLKQAVRALWRRKFFSLLVIATLGIGIGANVGIFTYLSAFVPDRRSKRRRRSVCTGSGTGATAFDFDRFSWLDYQLYEERAFQKSGVSEMTGLQLCSDPTSSPISRSGPQEHLRFRIRNRRRLLSRSSLRQALHGALL